MSGQITAAASWRKIYGSITEAQGNTPLVRIVAVEPAASPPPPTSMASERALSRLGHQGRVPHPKAPKGRAEAYLLKVIKQVVA
jgi:hypothetical protein